MLLIGMLHNRKDPATVKKSYAYAAVAKAEGAEFIYFSPKCVNFDTQRINGYIYNNGIWEKAETRFPDVIYNAESPEKTTKAREIIKRLKETIPFTTNSIGDKISVYDRLKKFGNFKKYIIQSEVIHTIEHFLEFLTLYHKIVFKPVSGHKGQGVYFIEKQDIKYCVLKGEEKYIYDFDELREFVLSRLNEEAYLAQPYINSKTKFGIAYDLRLHVQKNGEGKWVITAIYPRFAAEGSIVSNINSGGSTNYLVPFLKQEFGDDYFNVQRYLEVFALQLACHMDEIQRKCFSESLDELGIDVGLDDVGKIWIYEVNWRPGCPPAFYLELDVVINTIKYAMFIAKEYKRNRI